MNGTGSSSRHAILSLLIPEFISFLRSFPETSPRFKNKMGPAGLVVAVFRLIEVHCGRQMVVMHPEHKIECRDHFHHVPSTFT